MTLMVGDRVRLTGVAWDDDYTIDLGFGRDTVHTVSEVVVGNSVKFEGEDGNTWYVDDNPHALWGYELVKSEPEPEPELEISSVSTVKYAAQLSALDIGPTRTITWIKRYRYAGKDKEKIVTIYRPYYMLYNPRANKDSVMIRGYETRGASGWTVWNVPVSEEVVVSDI